MKPALTGVVLCSHCSLITLQVRTCDLRSKLLILAQLEYYCSSPTEFFAHLPNYHPASPSFSPGSLNREGDQRNGSARTHLSCLRTVAAQSARGKPSQNLSARVPCQRRTRQTLTRSSHSSPPVTSMIGGKHHPPKIFYHPHMPAGSTTDEQHDPPTVWRRLIPPHPQILPFLRPFISF